MIKIVVHKNYEIKKPPNHKTRRFLGINYGVFFALYSRNETPNIDKHGVEQYESTFCIQNTILNAWMESRLKGKQQ